MTDLREGHRSGPTGVRPRAREEHSRRPFYCRLIDLYRDMRTSSAMSAFDRPISSGSKCRCVDQPFLRAAGRRGPAPRPARHVGEAHGAGRQTATLRPSLDASTGYRGSVNGSNLRLYDYASRGDVGRITRCPSDSATTTYSNHASLRRNTETLQGSGPHSPWTTGTFEEGGGADGNPYYPSSQPRGCQLDFPL